MNPDNCNYQYARTTHNEDEPRDRMADPAYRAALAAGLAFAALNIPKVDELESTPTRQYPDGDDRQSVLAYRFRVLLPEAIRSVNGQQDGYLLSA